MRTNVIDLHARDLGTAATLSSQQVEDVISPLDVISVLNDAGISFVLVGAYGLGGWRGKPRATEAVDVVVARKHLKKATRILLTAFPQLIADDEAVVIRLRDRESRAVVIDLMKPIPSLYAETFKHTHSVEAQGQRYRVPSLEMALAMKFAAMISPNRQDADKHLDAHDFIYMVQRNPAIDMETLVYLGDLAFAGGGKRLQELVQDVRAGRKLVL